MSKLWHIATKDEIEDKLNTDFERGMTNEFAQSKLKQRTNASDTAVRFRPKTAMVCFSSVMAILLVILSVLFMFWGKPVLGTTVAILVFVSEIIGFAQDIVSYNKENKTKKLLVPEAAVIRDGKQKIVLSNEIAEGDIVVLAKGDVVPCDGRITYSENLEVDEKSVTGVEGIIKKSENAELSEETEIKDRVNMLYEGSSVVSGNCRMVACEVGGNTLLSEIKKENPETAEKSYMQDKLSEVGKVLSAISFLLLAALLCICIFSGADALESAMLCLALGAVLIPSRMSSVISYTVNHGMLKAAEGGSLIKTEAVAEKLALCDVVVTAKSGIITKNTTELHGVFTTEGEWTINADSLSAAEKSILRIILEFGAICTEPEKEKNPGEEYAVDSAILNAADAQGIDTKGFEIAKRYPFDVKEKLMTTVAQTGDGYRIITKGDLNEVISRCTHAVSSTSLDEMTDELKASLTEKYNRAVESGFKTVAVAYKDTNELADRELAEKGLTFVGALLIENQIREDSVQAVRELVQAGIKPVIATYDNAKLAEFVAKECGLMTEGSMTVTGKQLNDMQDSELDEKLENIAVFAELYPDDKMRILESFKRTGKTVCMISDSVCDQKALETAEISVSGKSGAEAATRRANVVTNGALSDFVNTIKQAQKLYLDVRKSLRFMISGAIAQMLFALFAMLVTNKIPVLAVQVLAIGILTAGILPFVLPFGGEWESHTLKNVKAQNSIFLKMWTRIIAWGVVMALAALAIFIRTKYFVTGLSDAMAYKNAQTAVFVFFVLSALFVTLYMRKGAFVLKEGKKELAELGGVIVLYAVLVLMALFVPGIKNLFGFDARHSEAAVIASLLPAAFYALSDAFKFIKSKKTEGTNGTDV